MQFLFIVGTPDWGRRTSSKLFELFIFAYKKGMSDRGLASSRNRGSISQQQKNILMLILVYLLRFMFGCLYDT